MKVKIVKPNGETVFQIKSSLFITGYDLDKALRYHKMDGLTEEQLHDITHAGRQAQKTGKPVDYHDYQGYVITQTP